MVTVIANQKRTIAWSGGVIPCTFDLLDSQSYGTSPMEWLRSISTFGARSRVSCVANWVRINIYTKSDTPWDMGTLTIGPNVYNIPTNSGVKVGTGFEELYYSGWTDNAYNLIRISIPVWTLSIFDATIALQATTDYITTRASPHPTPGIPDDYEPGVFYEETSNIALDTYTVYHNFGVTSKGRVYYSTGWGS